jgi:integrase
MLSCRHMRGLVRPGTRAIPSLFQLYGGFSGPSRPSGRNLHVTGPLVRGDLANRFAEPDEPAPSYPLAARRLGDVTRGDVRKLLAVMGGSRQAQRNLLNALSVVYRRAVETGSYDEDSPVPLRGVTPTGRAPDRSKRRAISHTDAELVIATLPSVLDRAIWATAFYAGLRCGELRALRWDDVSLAEWSITVCRSWDRREGAQPTKSRAGERVVPMTQRLRDALLALPHRDGLVLSADGRAPFSEWAVYDRAQRAWDAAGVERVTLHQARHTAGTLWRTAGVDVKDVQVFMGHASIQTTLDTYGWPTTNAVESSRARLDVYLG